MGPQFQADLNILHLSRHCDKSKWSRRPGVLSRDSGIGSTSASFCLLLQVESTSLSSTLG